MDLKVLTISFGPLVLGSTIFVLISQGIIDLPGGEKSPAYGMALVILAFLYLAVFWVFRLVGKKLKTSILAGVIIGIILFVPCTIGLIIALKNV